MSDQEIRVGDVVAYHLRDWFSRRARTTICLIGVVVRSRRGDPQSWVLIVDNRGPLHWRPVGSIQRLADEQLVPLV